MLRICMLLPIRYSPGMRVNPQIGIASYLVNFGHEMTWILSGESNRKSYQASLNGICIYVTAYKKIFTEKFLLGQAFNQMIAMVNRRKGCLKIFKEKKHDIIFARDDVFNGLTALKIKKKYKIPMVYELTDPLEQEWDGYKIEKKKFLFVWYLYAKMKTLIKLHIMRNADLILITTPWFEPALLAINIPVTKLKPFPNGVNLKSIRDSSGKRVREIFHLGESKTLIYLGVAGKVRNLEVLIQAFSKIKEKRPGVKLLMVGDGTGRKDLEKLAYKLAVKDDIIFTGQVPQSDVPDFIAAADIGVSPIPPLSFYVVSSPIKMLEYMAMGKPVVANREIHEHEDILNESSGGIVVPFDSDAFASAIIELLDNPEKAKEMGKKGYDWVAKNRTFDILARRLEERYLSLCEEHKKEISF